MTLGLSIVPWSEVLIEARKETNEMRLEGNQSRDK
jgi:hypothetical protein